MPRPVPAIGLVDGDSRSRGHSGKGRFVPATHKDQGKRLAGVRLKGIAAERAAYHFDDVIARRERRRTGHHDLLSVVHRFKGICRRRCRQRIAELGVGRGLPAIAHEDPAVRRGHAQIQVVDQPRVGRIGPRERYAQQACLRRQAKTVAHGVSGGHGSVVRAQRR